MTRLYSTFITTVLIASAAAQTDGDPVCSWRQPRAAVVRDTLYFDGGFWGTDVLDGVCQGNSVAQTKLNFSTPFNTTTNFTALFTFNNTIPADALYPSHYGGFMFADFDELYTFGGMSTAKVDNTTANSGVAWEGLYVSYGAQSNAQLGVAANYQPSGNITHKQITNGAGVNAPSEQLSFYFSGLGPSDNTSYLIDTGMTKLTNPNFPARLVESLLMVNTTNPRQSIWTEFPLPPGIARAEATLAFIPIGAHGAVVVIGGVRYPADIFGSSSCTLNGNYTSLNAQADSFMTNVSIYDIDSRQWYFQTTNGDVPKQLAQACAVVASSSDNSTHHIHLYGGYAGGANASTVTDDVWVLSVPSFTWLKVPSNNTNHGRTGHVCAKPYPNQMMVIGGGGACGNALPNYKTAFADVFNMNTLEWAGAYDPANWSEYVVPSKVKSSIPSAIPSGMNLGLQALFRTPYPGKLIKAYPYPVITPNGTVTIPPPQTTTSTPKPRPSWVLPVAIVVPIVVVLLLIGLGVCCFIKRKHSKVGGSSSGNTRVNSWLPGVRGEKSVISDGETHVNSPGPHEINGDNYFNKDGAQSRVSELHSPFTSPTRGVYHGSETAELHAHSVPAELSTEPRDGSSNASPYIRTHPMYPVNISGVASNSDNRSVSSPGYGSGPITPYELPQNRSKERVLAPVPNDMFLDQVQPRSPKIVAASTKPQPSHIASTADTGDVSPELRPVDDDRFPSNPPQSRGFGVVTPPAQRPYHHRHTSSMSSDVSNSSHNDENRRSEYHRSMTISPIPNSPSTIRTAASPTPQSPDMNTSSLDQAQPFTTSNVRRKEVNSVTRKQVGTGSTPTTLTDE